jgi:hypothetical protein
LEVFQVPYAAQVSLDEKQDARRCAMVKIGKRLRLPQWDDGEIAGLGEDEIMQEPGVQSDAAMFEEAADFLLLPYQSWLCSREWNGPVKEDVLLSVIELRFYRLMGPVREMYLQMVDELLGLGNFRDGPQMHRFDKVAEKYFGQVTFPKESRSALQLLKSSPFWSFLERRCDNFVQSYYDRNGRCYKSFATQDVVRREREALTERCPLRLCKFFGVVDDLGCLLWQVECRVRGSWQNHGEIFLYGRAAQLRHVPPHLKVLVNLACDESLVYKERDGRVKVNDLRLRVVQRLLLNCWTTHWKAYKNLRGACALSQANLEMCDSSMEAAPRWVLS